VSVKREGVNLEELIGLTLETARHKLAGRAVPVGVDIVETAPPVRPPRREDMSRRNQQPKLRAMAVQKPESQHKPGQHPTQPGEWRVLRARQSAEDRVELLVAREEVRAEAAVLLRQGESRDTPDDVPSKEVPVNNGLGENENV
jgi:hypothetical protein